MLKKGSSEGALMAKILLLFDTPVSELALHRSLAEYHKLFRASTIKQAYAMLERHQFDLIICAVHLEAENMFEFLNGMKDNPKTAAIPFLCFCGSLNKWASAENNVICKASIAMGASGYIALEEFLMEDGYDLESLRIVVEANLAV